MNGTGPFGESGPRVPQETQSFLPQTRSVLRGEYTTGRKPFNNLEYGAPAVFPCGITPAPSPNGGLPHRKPGVRRFRRLPMRHHPRAICKWRAPAQKRPGIIRHVFQSPNSFHPPETLVQTSALSSCAGGRAFGFLVQPTAYQDGGKRRTPGCRFRRCRPVREGGFLSSGFSRPHTRTAGGAVLQGVGNQTILRGPTSCRTMPLAVRVCTA